MALIDCPECGHKISDRAKSCPNCGLPDPQAGAAYLGSAKLMMELAKSESRDDRYKAAGSFSTPIDVLEYLCEDSDERVRLLASMTLLQCKRVSHGSNVEENKRLMWEISRLLPEYK